MPDRNLLLPRSIDQANHLFSELGDRKLDLTVEQALTLAHDQVGDFRAGYVVVGNFHAEQGEGFLVIQIRHFLSVEM